MDVIFDAENEAEYDLNEGGKSLALRTFQFKNKLKTCKSNDCRFLCFSLNLNLFAISHKKSENKLDNQDKEKNNHQRNVLLSFSTL